MSESNELVMKERLNDSFFRFNLDDKQLTPVDQAKAILEAVREEVEKDKSAKVGIVYSSLELESNVINRGYKPDGIGISYLFGKAKQPNVINQVKLLLTKEAYKDLKKNFLLLPITTTYDEIYPGTETEILEKQNEILTSNFSDIDNFIKEGGLVLGWQNPDSSSDNRYAITGDFDQLSPLVDGVIQESLKGYADAAGPKYQKENVARALPLQQWLVSVRDDAKKQNELSNGKLLNELADKVQEKVIEHFAEGEFIDEDLMEVIDRVDKVSFFNIEKGKYSKKNILLTLATFGVYGLVEGLREKVVVDKKSSEILEKLREHIAPKKDDANVKEEAYEVKEDLVTNEPPEAAENLETDDPEKVAEEHSSLKV